MARDFSVEWQDGDEESGELTVFFSDEAAFEQEDLVERSVEVIAGFPGVQSAIQEDRELIVVSGPDLDPQVLESMLDAWWIAELG